MRAPLAPAASPISGPCSSPCEQAAVRESEEALSRGLDGMETSVRVKASSDKPTAAGESVSLMILGGASAEAGALRRAAPAVEKPGPRPDIVAELWALMDRGLWTCLELET